jgi:hypothetical protein
MLYIFLPLLIVMPVLTFIIYIPTAMFGINGGMAATFILMCVSIYTSNSMKEMLHNWLMYIIAAYFAFSLFGLTVRMLM